jgi:hypothetical protein
MIQNKYLKITYQSENKSHKKKLKKLSKNYSSIKDQVKN